MPTSNFTPLLINYYDIYDKIPDKQNYYKPKANIPYSSATKGLLTASYVAVLNSTTQLLKNLFYYDEKGRQIAVFKQHYKGGAYTTRNYDAIYTTYNFTGQPTTVTREHYVYDGSNDPVLKLTVKNEYGYDHMGRKIKTWETITNAGQATGTRTLISQLEYNEIGQLTTKYLHSTDSTSLSNFKQKIDYTYNERGWLSTSSAPLFAMQLKYTDGSTPQFNGNIANQYWGTPGNLNKSYAYSYDKLNRLTAGISATGNSEQNITYDKMGNIQLLKRYNASGTLIDDLEYKYFFGSNLDNRLRHVNDKTTNDEGRTHGDKFYTYDGNGNMLTDESRAITGIGYNLLNLPQTVTRTGISSTYYYSAMGEKLRRKVVTTNTTYTDYIAGIQYTGSTLDFIQTEEGRAIPNGAVNYNYEYTLADHLGNNRVNFDVYSDTARRIQATDYYPFGMETAAGYVFGDKNKYLYNNKEQQDNLGGLYDYGARFYDPAIARWTTVDPLAEKYFENSPFIYTFNDPVKNIDPDGRDGIKIIDKQNCTITVKANYYVPTQKEFKGNTMVNYSKGDIKDLNELSKSLNKKSFTVSEGEYNGYTVKFELNFIDGGTTENAKKLSNSDKFEGVSIGNTFTQGDGNKIGYFFPKEKENSDGTTSTSTVGGVTENHKNITMNSRQDRKRNKVHEIWHTLFFDNDNADKGIGSYQRSDMPNQDDVNKLINNSALPAVQKAKNEDKKVQ